MIRLLSALRGLLGPSTPCLLHACAVCGHLVTRLTGAQAAAVRAGASARCARRGCSGRLVRADDLWMSGEVA